MKELFKRFTDFLFNNRFVFLDVPKPTPDPGATETGEKIPSKEEAKEQVDTDVADAIEQGDDLSIPPPLGEGMSADELDTMRKEHIATLSPEERAKYQPKTGDVKMATIDEITTPGVVGDAGKTPEEKTEVALPGTKVEDVQLAEAREKVKKSAEELKEGGRGGEKVDLAGLTPKEAVRQEAERVASATPLQPRGMNEAAQPMGIEMGTEGVVGDADKTRPKTEVKLEEEEK